MKQKWTARLPNGTVVTAEGREVHFQGELEKFVAAAAAADRAAAGKPAGKPPGAPNNHRTPVMIHAALGVTPGGESLTAQGMDVDVKAKGATVLEAMAAFQRVLETKLAETIDRHGGPGPLFEAPGAGEWCSMIEDASSISVSTTPITIPGTNVETIIWLIDRDQNT